MPSSRRGELVLPPTLHTSPSAYSVRRAWISRDRHLSLSIADRPRPWMHLRARDRTSSLSHRCRRTGALRDQTLGQAGAGVRQAAAHLTHLIALRGPSLTHPCYSPAAHLSRARASPSWTCSRPRASSTPWAAPEGDQRRPEALHRVVRARARGVSTRLARQPRRRGACHRDHARFRRRAGRHEDGAGERLRQPVRAEGARPLAARCVQPTW